MSVISNEPRLQDGKANNPSTYGTGDFQTCD